MFVPSMLAARSSDTRDLFNPKTVLIGILLCGFSYIVTGDPVQAEGEFSPSAIKKGVLLVASPSLKDPNFHEAVVLIVEHGPGGTLGLIVNRSLKVFLSEALPDMTILRGTSYRLFAGGPVNMASLLLLFRLKEPSAEARLVFDGVYVGTANVLERFVKQPLPDDAFRAFAGYAGWAPQQLKAEMLQGSWAILPPDARAVFDHDPATLWQDCIRKLQTPRTISN